MEHLIQMLLIQPQQQGTEVATPIQASQVQQHPPEQPTEQAQQKPVQTDSDLDNEFNSLIEPVIEEDTVVAPEMEPNMVTPESAAPTRDDMINNYITTFGITYTEATAIYDAGYIKNEYINMASPEELSAIPNINLETVQKIKSITGSDNTNQNPQNNPIQDDQTLPNDTNVPPDELSLEDEIPGEDLLDRLTSLRGRLENMESKDLDSKNSEDEEN